MPTYRIETTTQVRRVYEVTAENERQAEIRLDDNPCPFMVHEEDVSEEIDSIVLVAKPST